MSYRYEYKQSTAKTQRILSLRIAKINRILGKIILKSCSKSLTDLTQDLTPYLALDLMGYLVLRNAMGGGEVYGSTHIRVTKV